MTQKSLYRLRTITGRTNMKLFHGTTYNRYLEIIEAGFVGADCYQQVWNVSETETTYFWTEKFLINERDLDDIEGNIQDLIEEAGKHYAGESAEFALGSEKTNLRRVVLMFESEDLDPEHLEPDWSCENMDHCMQFNGKIPVDKIKKIWIDSEPLDLFAMFFIGMVVSRNDDNGYIRGELGENEKLSSVILEASTLFFKALQMEWLEDISWKFELEEHYSKNGILINSYSHIPLIEAN